MPRFEPGDIVRVPFPYTNRDTHQHRPALVVSGGELAGGMLVWALMITSRENRSWVGDVPIRSPVHSTGLMAPSMVRTAKIATIESAVAERIGRLGDGELLQVQIELAKTLRLARA